MTRLKEVWALIKSALFSPLPEMAGEFDDALLQSDQHIRKFGFTVIIVVFGGFGLWSMLAPLESAARGMGTVQVDGDTKPIQHPEGGVVAEIFVESGDMVVEGAALVQLDVTQLLAEQRATNGQFWAMRAQVDRLRSERNGAEIINFSEAIRISEDVRAENARDNEVSLFQARRADRLGEVTVLQQRIIQLQEEAAGGKAVVDAKNRVAESLEAELVELNTLFDEGYVDRQRIRQLERMLADTIAQIADQESRVASAKVLEEEAKLEILQLNKRFMRQVIDDFTQSEEDLYVIEQRLTATSYRLEKATLRSPVPGYVMAIKPKAIGAVIPPMETVMKIVPDIENLIVDVQLSPMDIDQLRIGQPAEVRFGVFKDSYTVTGELVKLSADTLTDEMTGSIYYQGSVRLLESDLKLLGDYVLMPGMPADVLIKTGTRTFMGYLTSPLSRMFENALIED